MLDLILLVSTSLDLYHGATAELPHAIAAVYIAVSIVFGKSMIQWADERFQYILRKKVQNLINRKALLMLNNTEKAGLNTYYLIF